MNRKSLGVMLMVIAGLLIFTAVGLYAGTEVKDVIRMENKAYSEHTKGIIEFTHAKHMDEYAKKHPDLYKNGCGECHHDSEGKPLDLKMGDDVQKCIECHSKPGERPKGKGAPKLSKSERLQYHAEAFHYNCKACHKKHNKENNTKAAPTSCSKCHKKK